MIRGSTGRQEFGTLEELSIGTTEPLAIPTEFDMVGPAAGWGTGRRTVSKHLAELYGREYERLCERAYERLHTRLYEPVRSVGEDLLVACLASWARTEEDVGIRWLSTLKSEPAWSGQAARFVLASVYHDFGHALSDDPSKWFYCQDPEPSVATQDEYPEWEWIRGHEAWLRDKYAGLWIAVLESRIVGVADSEVGVLKQAAELGYENTFSFCVPTETESPVVVVAR